MKFDFSIPQRQSKLGIFVLFVFTLQKIIRISIALIVVFAMNADKFYGKLIWLGIAIFSLSVIITFISYYYFTFQIDYKSKELIIQKGFLKKSKISIQLHKIQQINLNQNLLHKVFQLYEINVDTAGSGKKEVEIKAVSSYIANQLKQTIERLNETETINILADEEAIQSVDDKSIKIGFFTLIKTGITSRYVETFGWLFLVLNTLWENGKQINIAERIDTNSIEKYLNFNSLLFSVIIGFVFIFVLIILINLVRTIVRFFDFSITRTKHSLLLTYGLITTRNTIINPIKVQLIKISQNYFQEKLDIRNLRIEQASSEANSKEKKKDRIEVPGCSEVVKNQILDFIYNKEFTNSEVYIPSVRKFWIRFIFMIVLPIIIVLSVNTVAPFLLWNKLYLFISLYFVIGTLSCWRLYKNYKLIVTPDFILVQSGFWDIDTAIIEPYKIQAIQTNQLFWQKRLNIGSVYLYTAGGTISFTTGFYNQITQLSNTWLYQVETSTKKWM
uniref:PH domain-containing protein n=1 Tax=Flavobacterium sp. TaxID=239 RepID=UPI004049C8F0